MLLFGVRSGKLKIHAVDQTYIQEANARNHIQKNKGRAAKQRLTWRCSYVSRSSVWLIYDNPRTMVKKSDHRKRSCKSVVYFGFYSGRYAPLPFNRSLQQISFLILQEGGNKLTPLRIGNRNWIRIQFYSHTSYMNIGLACFE